MRHPASVTPPATPTGPDLPYELNRRLHEGFLKLTRKQFAEGYWRIDQDQRTTGPHPFQVAWETDDGYVMVIDPWAHAPEDAHD